VTQKRVYRLGVSELTLVFDDLTTSKAQVLVSSDDNNFTMSGGVSAAIRRAGGNTVVLDVAKRVPVQLGDVIVTSAGTLPAYYVFHAVTIGPGRATTPPEDIIRKVTAKCLALLEPLDVSSIAFPAIGAGAAGFSIDDVAVHMAEVIAADLLARTDRVNVSIYLLDRFGRMEPIDYLKFFEEFARRVPDIVEPDREARPSATIRSSAPSGKAPSPRPDSRKGMLELERNRQLLEQRLVTLNRAGATHERMEALLAQLQENLRLRIQGEAEQENVRDRGTEVFISYSHKDERLCKRLETHLTSLKLEGLITDWHDRKIVPGSEWGREIDQHLNSAKIILLLLSADFMASRYIMDIEVDRALERHEAGDACVIPVVLKEVDWTHSRFRELQALPKDGKAVTLWPKQDSALVNVVEGIRTALQELVK
jgi:O-acetyl-ADP-ribose deacetylase (regulator of RNase III)